MEDPEVSLRTIVSIIALIAYLFVISKRNKIAKKLIASLTPEQLGKISKFKLEITDAFYWINLKEKNRKYYLINLRISNETEIQNSFHASLEILYTSKYDYPERMQLDHNPKLSPLIQNQNPEVFPLNFIIEAGTTGSKFLLYEQKKNLKENQITKYTLTIRDRFGYEQRVELDNLKEFKAGEG
jgi:hypothetical protein